MGTAYSKVAEKQRTSVEGNDANGGNAVWAAMQNYDASASPAYVFIGNAMPKTDLTKCPDIMAQVTVTLTDWNDTDMYNPLDDFTGMDMGSGVIPLTEVCPSGIIGSTYASFPVGSTFSSSLRPLTAFCRLNLELGPSRVQAQRVGLSPH